MKCTVQSRWLMGLAALAVVQAACPALALVLHPGANVPVDRPPDLLLGRWDLNATCVVIGPDMVLTTRHQGGGVGTLVKVGDANYYVNAVWDYNDPNRTDLRIARLVGADFSQYAVTNTDANEAADRWKVVIGGYGKGRGDTLTDSNGMAYGYRWDGNANGVLRWGVNRLEGTDAGYDAKRGYYVNLLYDDFDKPGHVTGLDGEAALAEYDSGSGWFAKIGGQWCLVGLGWGVSHADSNSSWFDDPNTSNYDPERNWAIRMTDYAGWIQSVVPEPAAMAVLASGAVILAGRRRRRG